MASWWDDVWGYLQQQDDKTHKELGLPDATGAMSSITDTVNFGKVVWLNVSDYRMWRSLGWLLLGVLLMVIGFVVWNKKSIGAAAKAAVL
jgi:hypothetical protein